MLGDLKNHHKSVTIIILISRGFPQFYPWLKFYFQIIIHLLWMIYI